MKIYEITGGSSYETQWAWASGWRGPLDGPMPFLLQIELESKIAFWKVNPGPPGIHIDDTPAWAWPDFLSSGGAPPNYFVSRKVLESLLSEGIRYARATPIPVAVVNARRLKAVPPPEYFVLEAEQGIRFNFQAMGVPHDGHGKALVPASQWPKARIFDAASWNGLDLLAYPEVLFKGPNTILHCTERLVELAKRDGWTNVEFQWRHVE